MKKLFLIFTLYSSCFFGQFTIKESSNDWKEIGSYWGNIYLLKKDNIAKIKYKDEKANKPDITRGFKSQRQINNDRINESIENSSKNITDGFYEFNFSSKDEDLDKLYNLIENHFNEKKQEEITLEYPEGNMYLRFSKQFGIFMVSFGFDKLNESVNKNSSYSKIYTQGFGLSNIKKLFGK